jgi:acyl-CoA reductase-like NAD-dependent aldehyde dehydrogenase
VAKVAFTGSTATGQRVAQAAIANLRPATMELGGKSALLIFDDADLDRAVEWVMFGEREWREGGGGAARRAWRLAGGQPPFSPPARAITHTHTHLALLTGAFWTNGQICSSTSRILIQEG